MYVESKVRLISAAGRGFVGNNWHCSNFCSSGGKSDLYWSLQACSWRGSFISADDCCRKASVEELAHKTNHFGFFEHGFISTAIFFCCIYDRSGSRNSGCHRKCANSCRAIGMDSAKKKTIKSMDFSTILSVTGCSLLFSNRESLIIEPVGILLALGAGLSFAVYTLVSKQLISNRSSLSVTAVVFSFSALCLSPFLFLSDMTWIFKASGVAVSLHLGLAATAAAYLLFAKGLMNVSSSTAVTLSLAEPITAALLGVFLVGETLSTYSWAGLVLILTAICLLMSLTNRQDQGKVTSKN